MPTLADGSVDLILCDLPYGTTACAWDSVIPLEPLWKEYKRLIKPNGAIILFGSQPFTTTLIASQMSLFRYCLVWEKDRPTGHLHARNRPLKCHEDIIVFGPGVAVHVGQSSRRMTYNHGAVEIGQRALTRADCVNQITRTADRVGQHYDAARGFPRSVLRFAKDSAHLHPTQKPLALVEWLARTYSNEGDVVLDNCLGSGTTAVAAINTNRRWIGIERDPEYHEIARKRIEAAELARA